MEQKKMINRTQKISNDDKIYFIEYVLTFLSQVRVIHWQTNNYVVHKVFGKLYDDLNDLFDDIVEGMMGKYERFVINDKLEIELKDEQDINLNIFLDKNIKILNSFKNDLFDECDDIKNIIDEIVAMLNKTKYLITLKNE